MRFGYGGIVDVWDDAGHDASRAAATGKRRPTSARRSPTRRASSAFARSRRRAPTDVDVHPLQRSTQREFGLVERLPAPTPTSRARHDVQRRAARRRRLPRHEGLRAGPRRTRRSRRPRRARRPAGPRAPRLHVLVRRVRRHAATCRRSATTPAPTRTSRSASSRPPTRTATSSTRSVAVARCSTRRTSSRASRAHYLDTIQLIAKTFAFAMVLEVDDPTKPDAALLVDGNYGPLAMGTSVAFDLFARMLTRPEPGAYCSTARATTAPASSRYGLDDDIYVADPDPLPATTTYDFQRRRSARVATSTTTSTTARATGGATTRSRSARSTTRPGRSITSSEAFDSFISNSKEDFIDGRYKNVNFATVYPEQMRRLFAALVTGDIESFAPWATPTAGRRHPGRDLTYPTWHTVDGLGTRPATARSSSTPTFGFNEQLYAMVWGTMFFPTELVAARSSTTRASRRSPSEQISWPAAETYTFIDPATSITYRAHTTGTETALRRRSRRRASARACSSGRTTSSSTRTSVETERRAAVRPQRGRHAEADPRRQGSPADRSDTPARSRRRSTSYVAEHRHHASAHGDVHSSARRHATCRSPRSSDAGSTRVGPRWKVHISPGLPIVHVSSRVSGVVATTATRSLRRRHLREVDAERRRRRASPCRTAPCGRCSESFVAQRAKSCSPSPRRKLNVPPSPELAADLRRPPRESSARRGYASKRCSSRSSSAQNACSLSVVPIGWNAAEPCCRTRLAPCRCARTRSAPPQLAHERVRVRERDLAARPLADVRDREQRLDRILAHERRERRVRGRSGLEERADRRALRRARGPSRRRAALARRRAARAPRTRTRCPSGRCTPSRAARTSNPTRIYPCAQASQRRVGPAVHPDGNSPLFA